MRISRLTTVERGNLSPSPSEGGYVIFNTTTEKYEVFNPISSGWEDVNTSLTPPVFTEQTHTTGGSVIINDGVDILYVDPASTIASLTVILPENPINRQEVKVSFGGTIALGTVATVLAVTGNTGHTVLGGVTITTAEAGDGYIFKFQESLSLWRIF